jgi:membrane-anchored glycerophosphoryl diester phosphodiesterase (GDPDase)
MRFILIQTAIGLILSLSGVQTIYIFITGLDKGTSILLLILALVLIGVGFFFLMKAGKSDASVFKRLKNIKKLKMDDTAMAEALEKNNEITSDWTKTVEKRDKLKMLEVSAAAATQTE